MAGLNPFAISLHSKIYLLSTTPLTLFITLKLLSAGFEFPQVKFLKKFIPSKFPQKTKRLKSYTLDPCY